MYMTLKEASQEINITESKFRYLRLKFGLEPTKKDGYKWLYSRDNILIFKQKYDEYQILKGKASNYSYKFRNKTTNLSIQDLNVIYTKLAKTLHDDIIALRYTVANVSQFSGIYYEKVFRIIHDRKQPDLYSLICIAEALKKDSNHYIALLVKLIQEMEVSLDKQPR